MTTPVERHLGDDALRAGTSRRIVAVIPARNEASSISRVVQELRDRGEVALHRVIVVDNGSTDGTGGSPVGPARAWCAKRGAATAAPARRASSRPKTPT